MWAYESVFYQIYPLGFCGAPFENDGVLVPRIRKVKDWIPHMKELGINAIYFSPLFESDTHGYNTRDYKKLDVRLGTNEDFKDVVNELHANGIRVVVDGVFNHVGRGFWAFQDVLANRERSSYVSWFHRIDFNGNSDFNDGLWYEGWEGHQNMVKLNLHNEDVIQYLFDCVKFWIDEFNIDGIRLDVAYSLDENFMDRLRGYTQDLKEDFFLLGEMIHGDYNRLVRDGRLHSATNYECYKGLYSSFNCMNMFEITHSVQRQFGANGGGIYQGKHLLSFVDNHDVVRIGSVLNNERHLPLVYTLMMGMPGIPCIYYGSEWGIKGEKGDRDLAIRPCLEQPEWTELTDWISKLSAVRKESKALQYGGFQSIALTNRQCIWERRCDDERMLIAVNADEQDYTAYFNYEHCKAVDLMTGTEYTLEGNFHMPAYTAYVLKVQ